MNLTLTEVSAHEIDANDRDIKVIIDLPEERQIVLLIDSVALQDALSSVVDRGMASVASNKKDTKSLMMKASINSALIAMGPFLIDLLWYRHDLPKPKPGRKDDLIEWYTKFFVTQVVGLARDANVLLHLLASVLGQLNEQTAVIRVSGARAEPLSGSENADAADTTK